MRAYRHPMRFALHIKEPDSLHGLPDFYNMGIFTCNISAVALAFTDHRSLPTVHCSLLIANGPSAPKGNSPARAPGHTVFAIPYTKLGACAGEGLAGGAPEGCASP